MQIGHIFLDEEVCLQYLIEHEVVTVPTQCEVCHHVGMGHPSLHMYQCQRRGCRKKQSIYKGTFFFRSRIPCNMIMHAAYKFLNGDSSSSIMQQVGILLWQPG